jgi:flagellin
MLSLNTNLNALTAQRAIGNTAALVATSAERLSTGYRINSAKDDPAGLGIANRMQASILGYTSAIRNVNQGLSMTEMADSGLSQISDVLQRMRELAVQSSSGTSSTDDRTNLQIEFTQLRSEIDSLAKSTQYNRQSLLDGTVTKVALQVGINAGDSFNLTFSSAKSTVLGVGNPTALTSIGASTTALSSGDLLINGVTVGASVAADDTTSSASNSGSAIAKVAAINDVSAASGVVATVGYTTVYGSAMSTGANAGTVSINGTATDTITLLSTYSTDTNRGLVVAAINNIAGTTGVTAVDGGDATHGVVLKSTLADGRNITVAHTTLTASNTGLVGTDGTYAGTYTLRSIDESAIEISSVVAGTLANADLYPGTYAANVAQFATQARAGSIAAPTALTAGDLLINGYSIRAATSTDDTATVATTTSATKASSAIAMAAAINAATASTGVTAKANANILVGTGFSAGDVDTVYLNGQSLAVSLSSTSTAATVVSDLNTITGLTGVVAEDNGSGVTLTASDGRTISLGASYSGAVVSGERIGLSGNVALTGAAASAAGAMAYISTVKLSADEAFTIASGSNGNTSFATLGFRVGTYGGSAESLKISSQDVSTQTGAQTAITTIDGAIDMVSTQQAKVGAAMGRMSAQASFLSSSLQNATTARGRIMDTDYAQETTQLARAQIIQQAATAMLAQANMNGDWVKALLKS